jgi:hypothetical protein
MDFSSMTNALFGVAWAIVLAAIIFGLPLVF